MFVRFRSLRACGAAFVAAALLLAGCGGGGGTSTTPRAVPTSPGASTPTATPAAAGSSPTPVAQPAGATLTSGVQAGSIKLPAGSTLNPSSLTVSNSLGTAAPAASTGSFTLPAFTNGPQFAVAANAAGAPVLAGLLSPAEPQLNAHTTAELLAYYAAGLFMLPAALQQQAYALLATSPGFAALEAAVTNDIVASPGSFPSTGPALATLAAGYAAGTTSIKRSAGQRRGTASLLVDPSNGQSGVTVLNANQLQIAFQNEKRRAALAYIDQVSFATAGSGGTTITQAPVSDVVPPVNSGYAVGDTAGDYYRILASCGNYNNCIPATTPLKSFTGTLTDLLYGNSAFAQIQTGNLNLPTANSLWTRYQVTVVGPGGYAGATMTSEQAAGQKEVSLIFLFQDLFLPFITTVLMPYATDLPALFGKMTPAQASALNDLINLYAGASPQIIIDAENGDMKGALSLTIAAILGNDAIKSATINWLVSLATTNVPNSVAVAELQGALASATKVADALLVGFSTSVTLKDLLSSDQADQFTVIVVPTTVTLTPATNLVDNDFSVHLKSSVPLAGGSGLQLSYTWTNSATVGHFTDFAVPPDTDNFMSNYQNEGLYTANHTGTGTDTVSVTVFAYDTSGNKTEKIQLGSASATVNVAPNPLGQPPTGLDQSRCAGMSIAPHAVHVGDLITGTVSSAGPLACGGDIPPLTPPTWSWGLGGVVSAVSGCGLNDVTCVFKANAATSGYQILCLNGNSRQGGWDSCDYYGALP